jgi:hypothetical protein
MRSSDRGVNPQAAEREAPGQPQHLVRTLTPIDGLSASSAVVARTSPWRACAVSDLIKARCLVTRRALAHRDLLAQFGREIGRQVGAALGSAFRIARFSGLEAGRLGRLAVADLVFSPEGMTSG